MRDRVKLHAFAVEIGVNPSSVTRWVRGGFMTTEHAIHVCDALHVSLDWLLLGRGDPEITDDVRAGEVDARVATTWRRLPPEITDRIAELLDVVTKLLHASRSGQEMS